MFGNIELSVEALVARNLGDDDWEDLLPAVDDGCYRKATMEIERSFEEAEPNIDKFTSDTIHAERHV